MKKLLQLLTLLSTTTFAGGTLGLSQPMVSSNETLKLHPTLSLYVYEPLSVDNGLFYQSWTGIRSGRWFTTEHSVMKNLGSFNLGVGPAYENSNGRENTTLKIYTEFQLWQ
jgi:hypothetical protein